MWEVLRVVIGVVFVGPGWPPDSWWSRPPGPQVSACLRSDSAPRKSSVS